MVALISFAMPFMLNGIAAGDAYYLAGDAFFVGEFSEDSAEEMAHDKESGQVEIGYYLPPDEHYMGYKLGHPRLKITEFSSNQRTHLRNFYFKLRGDLGWPKIVRQDRESLTSKRAIDYELNPFILLVHNKSFDPEKYCVGLKYNETWMTPTVVLDEPGVIRRKKLVIAPSYSPLFPFTKSVIDDANSLIDDWKDSFQVPPLLVKASEVSPTEADEIIPLSISFDNVALYILYLKDLPEIYQRKNQGGFFRFSSDGIEKLIFEEESDECGNFTESRLVVTPIK